MRLTIVFKGKRRRFYIPLSRLLVRLILRGVMCGHGKKTKGQGCDERDEGRKLTAEEKASVAECAVRLAGALKAYRRQYGGWTLAEVYDGESGEGVTIEI